MNQKEWYSSGAKWESIAGYSRAVKVGPFIEIAGTTAMVNGDLVGSGDAYLQTKTILKIIKEALEVLGGQMENVIKTTIYVRQIEDWQEISKAHGEVFGEIRPASTMVEVSGLIDPGMLVEIEARAYLPHK